MTVARDQRRANAAPSAALPSLWVIWPALAVTWVAFTQVLSFQGLAIWVVGGSVLTALCVFALAAARRRLLSMGAMVAMTVIVAAAADRMGGDSAGPVTRAALMSSAVAGAMALLLSTRYRATILVPATILLAGALGLGAADATVWLGGMWVVAACATLAMVGPFRQSHLRDQPRLTQFALLLGLAGAVAVVSSVALAPIINDPWTLPSSSPTRSEPAPEVAAVSPADTAKEASAASWEPLATTEEDRVPWLLMVAIGIAVALSVAIFLALLRGLWAALLWARERRRLQSGSREESALGAWRWILLMRARHDSPIPVHVSPDVAVQWSRHEGDDDVLTVASIATKVAFTDQGVITRVDRSRAWTAALTAGRPPSGASLRDKWRWARRTPAQVRRRRRDNSGS